MNLSPDQMQQNGSSGDKSGSAKKRTGLGTLLDSGVMLSEQQQNRLEEAYADGIRQYTHYNETRLEMAFSSFDEEMRLAVYELFFLLHVNDPKLANFQFTGKCYEYKNGVRQLVSLEQTASLYVEGAPAGLRGIHYLPSFIKSEYESYIEKTFKMKPYGPRTGQKWLPIVSMQSVGSIGTVGHKTFDSDLDLQVVYDLNPFVYETGDWGDSVFKEAINKEHRWWINAMRRQQKLSMDDFKNPGIKKQLSAAAANKIASTYPGLYRYLVREDAEFKSTLFTSTDKTLRIQMLHELLNLMKRAEKINAMGEIKQKEALLKRRLNLVQDYITAKFPDAEVYLFVYSVETFRQAQYFSTLEFKESSGSAYEYILNYDTLMPGIQFTPMVPTHFILPPAINNDTTLFNRLMDYMRFQALPIYSKRAGTLLDLGATPNLTEKYVAEHGGAIYWEAFKGSAGNLPKAILNLFRFEMLLDKRFNQTIIQMIKEPEKINKLANPKPSVEPPPKEGKSTAALIQRARQAKLEGGAPKEQWASPEDQLEAMANLKIGLPPWAVLELERKYSFLLLDPWWLRYKAMKIAFAEHNGVLGIEPEERNRISKVIDLAFSLHLRITDVMGKENEKKDGDSRPNLREQVLTDLLGWAFPEGSARRINLESLFAGGVRGLIFFEKEMRDLFQRSITRVEKRMADLDVREHKGDQEEVNLWINYYMEHFHPHQRVVPRVIMKHLKTARDGIEISLRESGWLFMSILRKETLLEAVKAKRDVSYLPERVLLLENARFLNGLAHCILNGYYGVVKPKTPDEHLTPLELDLAKVDQKQNIHNDLAYLTQEQVNDIARRINSFFGYQPYNYTDILRVERKITGAFIFLNMWKFGELSMLYRDNFGTWYCEEFFIQEIFQDAHNLAIDMDKMLRHKSLYTTLFDFLDDRGIDLGDAEITAWANPNSLNADRTMGYRAKVQDMEDGITFTDLILKNYLAFMESKP